MHAENLTALTSNAADAPGLEQPDGEQPALDAALGEPPPQAANPIPTVTRAASSGAGRQRRRPLVRV
jgi:hypothetical protein